MPISDLVRRWSYKLQGRKRLRRTLQLVVSLTIAVVFPRFASVEDATGWMLLATTHVNVTYGGAAQQSQPVQLLHEDQTIKFSNSPCIPQDVNCYTQVSIEPRHVVWVAGGVVFLIALFMTSVLVALWIDKPASLLVGAKQIVTYQMHEDNTCTVTVEYASVRTLSKDSDLFIPLELNYFVPTGVEEHVEILSLEATGAESSKRLSPRFQQPTPFYKGELLFASGIKLVASCGIRYKVANAFAYNADVVKSRFGSDEPVDWIHWISRGYWDLVEVRVLRPQTMRVNGTPWVMALEMNGEKEKKYADEGWKPEAWTLTLQDVGPGREYRIVWQLDGRPAAVG